MLIARSQDWRELWQAAANAACARHLHSAGVAIGINWLMFVWAVSINQIVQISLGYFINPLVSVVLGVLVFRERLRQLQWVAIALAAAGVLYLTVALRLGAVDRAVPGGDVRHLRRAEENRAARVRSRDWRWRPAFCFCRPRRYLVCRGARRARRACCTRACFETC